MDPDAPAVDDWLDEAQSGHAEEAVSDYGYGGRFLGSIFDDNSESYSRGPSGNGHSPVEGNLFRNGASGGEPEVRENEGPTG